LQFKKEFMFWQVEVIVQTFWGEITAEHSVEKEDGEKVRLFLLFRGLASGPFFLIYSSAGQCGGTTFFHPADVSIAKSTCRF
jgi:hypothetical protein